MKENEQNKDILKYVSTHCFACDRQCHKWSIVNRTDYCDGKKIESGHICPLDIMKQ